MLSFLLWSTAAEARVFEMSGGVRMGYSYMLVLRSPNSMTLGFEQIHRLNSGWKHKLSSTDQLLSFWNESRYSVSNWSCHDGLSNLRFLVRWCWSIPPSIQSRTDTGCSNKYDLGVRHTTSNGRVRYSHSVWLRTRLRRRMDLHHEHRHSIHLLSLLSWMNEVTRDVYTATTTGHYST